MTRSDSNDSDQNRRRSRKKKKERYRSRSRSSSSDRYRKSKKSRARSRSRERRRSRSRDHYKSRSRSRDRSHKRRERSRSRSRDRDNKYSSKDYDDKVNSRSKAIFESNNDKTSLKEKIKTLSLTRDENKKEVVPSLEQLQRFEKDSFVQESFSSTIPNASNQPKQKKKKKKKKNLMQSQAVSNNLAKDIPEQKAETISHESAMFGNTLDTMHVGKFASRIDNKRKEILKNVETDDVIFGAMFCESPEIRMKRWIEKLGKIRKKAREAGY
ncbi:serine/arginine-rich splicing factor 4-like [Hydractinia symbiolongicarpus]|uniref:serine/arginine-rich splicing factor 4-like n=1 Tax=Hydractinia symbiolongicarpus TaxID=13093 RepID=UPI00254A37BA|nr:serine/arginine-rich splicing factor 4-like [Hydractinia symbiolongicarpus]XP_057302235.1 serine/arginine-rich splicing factor 4-like [Hydractinia symbiolongicarpus]